MDNSDRSSPTQKSWTSCALVMLISVLLLLFLPALMASCSFGLIWADSEGMFTHWGSLGAPPTGGVELLAATTHSVYVRAESGDAYIWEACGRFGSRKDCWRKVPAAVEIPQREDVESMFAGKVGRPPGVVVDSMVAVVAQAEALEEAHYALLDDGTVWRWYRYGNSMATIGFLIFSFLAGVIIAVLIIIVLWARAVWRLWLRDLIRARKS